MDKKVNGPCVGNSQSLLLEVSWISLVLCFTESHPLKFYLTPPLMLDYYLKYSKKWSSRIHWTSPLSNSLDCVCISRFRKWRTVVYNSNSWARLTPQRRGSGQTNIYLHPFICSLFLSLIFKKPPIHYVQVMDEVLEIKTKKCLIMTMLSS